MTKNEAITRARRQAERQPDPVYVVHDPGSGDPAERSYYIAELDDFWGFFAGLPDSAIIWSSED